MSPARGRRGVLGGCAALLALAACRGGPGGAADSAPPADSLPPTGAEGWWPVELAAHPALAEVGGWARVSVPEALLEVVVAQPEAGRFVAVWAICTHGACEVEYTHPEALVCPCHGSVFDTTGAVLEGPATVALRRFPTRVEAGVLYLWRPL